MSRHRKFDEEFKQGAVRLVLETGNRSQAAREFGVNHGTLVNRCASARRRRDGGRRR